MRKRPCKNIIDQKCGPAKTILDKKSGPALAGPPTTALNKQKEKHHKIKKLLCKRHAARELKPLVWCSRDSEIESL